MIDYREQFHFTNDVGEFMVQAHTEEHPSAYGNGTLLVFDVASDFPCQKRMLFDVRYDGSDMAAIARKAIEIKFGVEV